MALFSQMANALRYIHANLITHDDVKPENIVWSTELRRAVLIDFGAALDYNTVPASFFNPSGTPPYVPPEFLQKIKHAKGDIWALGLVMLFALRHISLPDGGWHLPAVTAEDGPDRQRLRQWFEQIGQLRAELTTAEPLIYRMLDPDLGARINSSDLVQQLQAINEP
jgi:serine/threonine protein kinase